MAKKIAIAGFGREGQAILRFLKRTRKFDPVLHGTEIWILDKNPHLHVPRGTHGKLGKDYLSHLEKYSIIFRSPGIPYECSKFRSARAKGVQFESATKLFFEYCPAKIIGVTGTKGKGTTSTLLFQMLRGAKKPVFLAGNIGVPAIDLLPKLMVRQAHHKQKKSLVVLELSSFQLQDLETSPSVAVVLDIFPDHQNSHRNLREYYSAKANIARFQRKRDRVFFFPHNSISRRIAAMSHGQRIAVDGKNFSLFAPNELKLKGAHNFLNAAMAGTVALALDVPRVIIRKIALQFRGLPHRLEFVRVLRAKDRAIAIWNDSASSNPGAAAAAIRAFKNEHYILIAGGKDKNLDYRPLAQALKESPAQLVVLFGENKKKIARAITKKGIPIGEAKNLREALSAAFIFAKNIPLEKGRKEVAIVLSPGSASFDMFKNFEHRGDVFKTLVFRLK